LDDREIKREFRRLSALEKADGEVASSVALSARAGEDAQLAAKLLRSYGYYDAAATFVIAAPEQAGAKTLASINVTPGRQYVFGGVTVASGETDPQNLARSALLLIPGDPIVATDVVGAEANISLVLPQNGYPFVELGKRDIELDEATFTGDYTLPVSTGPKSSFGEVLTPGETVFDAEHVTLLARFRAGELYDSRKIDDLQQALSGTGLFATVAVEPVRTGRAGPDNSELVDLRVSQAAGPARTLAASAGYGTGEGFKIQGSWTHRNLFPPEGALIVDGIAGTQQQGAGITFRRSNAGRRDRTVLLLARAQHDNFEAYEAYTATISGRISRESTPLWQKRWTWSYGFEILATNEKRADATRLRADGTYFIAALPVQVGYDTSDNLLDASRGFRLMGRISPEYSKRASAGGGSALYFRAQLDGSIYYPVMDNLVLAGRARLGSIVGADRDQIAPSRRVYAGGGGSVRGFGYQDLGPLDSNNEPIGGRSVTEFALEARYRFGNYGIVPFIDAGQVYEGITPKLSDLRFGAGIGARLYTNFGPVRVDVATPIGRRAGEPKIAFYISIGQAF
jgi:translocation and assembly module TamA